MCELGGHTYNSKLRSALFFVFTQVVVVKKLCVTKAHILGSPPVLTSCINKSTIILNGYHDVLEQIQSISVPVELYVSSNIMSAVNIIASHTLQRSEFYTLKYNI
jgi:hypothetical protein